jgi:hypothetical protein
MSIKDKSLKEKVIEETYSIIRSYCNYPEKICPACEEESELLVDSILSLIKEALPKERPHCQFLTKKNLINGEDGARTVEDWKKKGRNEYREEVLKILGVEDEGN